MNRLKNVALIVGLALSAAACSSASQKTDKPYWNYRAEMLLLMEGQTFEGLAVTRNDQPLSLQIYAPITLNRVEFSTCHRHEVIRNTAKVGWFGSGGVPNTMPYVYEPTALEKQGHCPLFIQAFNDQVQKAWGLVSFKTDQALPAHLDCNGRGWTYSGISVCQTKAGLEQELTFKAPVEFEAIAACKITTKDKMKFKIRSDVGWCKATFSDGRATHDLIQLGYDQVVVY